jgi:glycosyltransferase involved in cell wall biosynthesis
VLEAFDSEEQLKIGVLAKSWSQLGSFLRLFGVRRLHVHHALGFSNEMQSFLSQVGLPYDFTLHDYMVICPRIFMVRDGRYCGEPDDAGCQECLRDHPPGLANDISEWRGKGRWLIEGAERVLCPSHDAALRVTRYAPQANVIVVPHEVQDQFLARKVRLPPLTPKMKMRIAALGGLARHKGGAFLLECAAAWQKSGLRIELWVIGAFAPDLMPSRQHTIDLHITGHYTHHNVQHLIEELDPHLILFPQRGPETYSYTLSEALTAGVPLLVPNIGAFRERTQGQAWCWSYDPMCDPKEIADLIVSIRDQIEAGRAAADPPAARRKGVERATANPEAFYPNDYLRIPPGR